MCLIFLNISIFTCKPSQCLKKCLLLFFFFKKSLFSQILLINFFLPKLVKLSMRCGATRTLGDFAANTTSKMSLFILLIYHKLQNLKGSHRQPPKGPSVILTSWVHTSLLTRADLCNQQDFVEMMKRAF